MRKVIASCALVAVVLGVGAWVSAQQRPAGEPASLERGQLRGITRPSERVDLALRVSGVIAERPVDTGDRVEAGQVLARLDSELEKATLAINRLKASSGHQVKAAELTAKLRKEDLARVERLRGQNAATEWELQQAKIEEELARVRVEYAKFQQQLAAEEANRDEVVINQRELKAPWSGIIWRTHKQAGEAVEELQPILELVRLDPLRVEINVPEQWFGQISPGRLARVTVGDDSREAKVVLVDPGVDAASGTFRVKLEMQNTDATFTAGRSATVQFKKAE